MTKEQYLLTQLAEEAAEVSQAALKAVRFGLNDTYPLVTSPTTLERLKAELSDLVGVIQEIESLPAGHPGLQSLSGALTNALRIENKRNKIRDYMAYSERKGILATTK